MNSIVGFLSDTSSKVLKYDIKWCKMMNYTNPYIDPYKYHFSKNMPYFDIEAYKKYPKYNWVYDKLYIAQSQGLMCGKLETLKYYKDNIKYPIFIKPRWGHKSASSKNCFKIKNKEQLMKYIYIKDMMWSDFIDDKETMTDFIMLNGNIKHQITYIYSDKQNGFSDVWKYISPDNKPPNNIIEWVKQHMGNYTGMLNVQYRGTYIIEVGLRLARGGAYILSSDNKYLIQNINNVIDDEQWDYSIQEKMKFKPFYSFKCYTNKSLLYLLPHHAMENILNKSGAKPFREYYFEPVGDEGLVFYQFLHEDFDKGIQTKELIENIFNNLQYFFIIFFILGIFVYNIDNKYGIIYYCLFILLYFTRFLNPLYVNNSYLKAKKQIWCTNDNEDDKDYKINNKKN
jgi:hypothetical protein